MRTLPDKMRQAAALIGRGVILDEVAKRVGVNLKTLWDWRVEHTQAAAFNAAIARAANEYTRELMGEALAQMSDVVKTADPMNRVGAARVIGERLKAVEGHEIALEKNAADRERLKLEKEAAKARLEALKSLGEGGPAGVVYLTGEGMGWPVVPGKPPVDPA